jgi:predicted Co/Zn/Cd cation transporter (cation efflux family)
MESIEVEFKIDRQTWPKMDVEEECDRLAQKINDALRDSGNSSWTGSSRQTTLR